MDAILRGAWAVLGGYLVMLVLMFAFTDFVEIAVPGWYIPGGSPSPSYLAVNAAYSLAAAAAGGYVAAGLAPREPMRYVWGLAALAIVVTVLFWIIGTSRPPLWYQTSRLVGIPLGVMMGGWLRILRLRELQ